MSDKQLPQYTQVPDNDLGNTPQGGSYQVPPPYYGDHIPPAPVGYHGNAPQSGLFQVPHHYYGDHTPQAPVSYLGNTPQGGSFQGPHHYYGYYTPPAPVGYLSNSPQGGLFQARPHYYDYHIPPAQMYPYPSNRSYPDIRQPLNATYPAPTWEIQPPSLQYPHPGGAWVGPNPVTHKTELTFQHIGRQADSPKTRTMPPSDQADTNDTKMEAVPAKQDVTERLYYSVQDVNLYREIEVREIPDTATKDMLLNFFENERKGGGPVADIKYSESDHTAIVTFESPESVDTILKRQPCILLGKNIIISARTTSSDMDYMTPVAATSEGGNSEKKDGTSSICINGFKKTTTEETFTYYFENKRRSGGGKISSYQVDREEGSICITFVHSSDAAEVLKRSHTIDGVTLTVRPYVLDEKMVLVTGLSGLLSEDTIQNFLEAKVHAGVQSITFGDDKTKAVVEFENPCDFNKIKKTCEKYKLGGVHVTVCRVPKCSSVKVTGLPSKISKETLIHYFENKRRSGGDTVERVELDPSNAVCLVYFQDHQVVGEVCKRSHVIEKTPVEIHPYHSCLGFSGAEKKKEFLPGPVMLTDFDPHKKKFLMKNLFFRNKLENELAKFYSKIIWKSEPSDNVHLECTLTSDIEGYLLLAESWQNTSLDCFKNFLKTLQSRVFQLNAQEWGLMLERLQRLNVSDQEKVAVFLEENNYTVTLVGDNNIMPAFIKQVEDAFAVKLVTKKFSMKKWESQYLLAISFMNEIKDSDWNVVAEIHENEVELKGGERTVNEAAVQMLARLKDAITTKDMLLPEKLNLLQKENIRAEVTEKLKASNIKNYPWEVRDGHLYLYTSTKEESSVMINVMESMISQFFIELDNDIPSIFHDPDWRKLKERMYLQYPDRILISDEKPGKVTVFSVSNIITRIKEELERFFAEHALHNEVLKLDKGVVRFIQSHDKAEVDRFVQEASREKTLQISFESLYTIAITGTKENLKAGKQMIKELEKQIQKQQYTFRRQGIVLYIGTPKGKECIKKAEKEAESVIELKGIQKQREEVVTGRSGRGWLQKRQHFHQLTKCATAKLSCGVKIKVFGGDMTELNVDVMVNAANSNLQHGAGVAAAFVRRGGNEIQEECTEYVKKNGILSDGDVFVGSSGTLKCKALVHAVGPVWKDGESGEQKLLIKTISNCMQEVGKLKAKSVVFPAVCAGIFGFPPEKACTSIVDTICNFFKEQKGNAGMNEVYLCDINRHCVFCFKQALEKKLGKDNIKDFIDFLGVDVSSMRLGNYATYWSRADIDDFQSPYFSVLVELQPEGRSVPYHAENTKDLDDVSDGKTSVASTNLMFGNIQVKIVKAVLAKEYSDVIVNSVSKELKLEEGRLSKTLLKEGGGEIQNECNSSYPNGIEYGDIAITGSGKLPCKKIFHVALTAWDRNEDSAPAVKTLVSDCLVEADKLKMKSISIPPIGTGSKRYPKHLVAKEMLQAVYDFCHQNQRTSIKNIRIVVFYKDEDVLEAFEDAGKSCVRRIEESGVGLPRNPSIKQSGAKVKKVAEDSGKFKAGKLKICIYQGDITEERTDVIINSSNGSLDLRKGKVSKAILAKGGDALIGECEAQKFAMKISGVAVTSGGKMKCKNIVHVLAQESAHAWKPYILKCLLMAESIKAQSVAFPALGTGMGCTAEEMAVVMLETIGEYQAQVIGNHHMQELRIVVFQRELVPAYVKIFQRVYSAGAAESESKRDKDGSEPVREDSSLDVVIYARSKQDINKAIRTVLLTMDSEWTSKTIADPGIKYLNPPQKDDIYKTGIDNNVNIKIEAKKGEIQVMGFFSNVMPISDKIHKILRQKVEQYHVQKEAQLLANVVKWFYIKNGKEVEFTANTNITIEKAFQAKSNSVKIQDRSGEEYEIDFNKMVEKPVKHSSTEFPVIRRDLIDKDSITAEKPKHWVNMKSDENLKIVPLNSSDPEYKKVVQNFHKSVGSPMPIVKVERIQNMTLYTQYMAKKRQLDMQNSRKDNERVLWHGTPVTAMDSINAHGFNRSYCRSCSIGNGVYFAVQASYSASGYAAADSNGDKRIYQCRVLTGDYTQGLGGLRMPPAKSSTQPHILYDSVVDNTQSPVMFVIFHDAQAYPDYLITFK